MASTANLLATKLGVQQVQKEATLNETADLLDNAIAGKLDIVTTGGTTTLTGTPVAPQAQHMFLNVTGALTSNKIIEIPVSASTGRNRIYVVKNGTTGAFTVTVRTVGGSGVTVTQGKTSLLLYDGTNIVRAIDDPATLLGTSVWASAFHNADQSISNGTQTALAFNSERWDTDSIHDNSTNNSRLTCKTAGVYLIVGTMAYANNITGVRQAGIRLNGSTFIASALANAVSGSTQTALTVSRVYSLVVNDYVELMAFQDSGGSLNVSSSGNYSPEFMIHRLGA